MSFKEVKELRKNGQLDEALKLAKSDIEFNPDDIWNKRSIAWVYYEYLKGNNSLEGYEQFVEYLDKINELEMPQEESMFYDNCAWQIISILFDLLKDDKNQTSKVITIFNRIKSFHYSKPSEPYSVLFKAFHKCLKESTKYIEFSDWWDFDSFRGEDFVKEKLENGREIISIAEQAIYAYSKKILEGKRIDIERNDWFVETVSEKYSDEIIDNWLVKLNDFNTKHPHFQFIPYYIAKLLLNKGNQEEGLSAFLPFAKKRQSEFWVWDVLADFYQKNESLYEACLCKALTCRSPQEFLIKTREKIASYFISKNLYREASYEIQQIIKEREKNQWKIPAKVTAWKDAEWYISPDEFYKNDAYYKSKANRAEEILFFDIPEEIAVVEFVNHDKKILNFIISKTKHGFFKYDSFLKSARIGDVLSVRLEGSGQNSMYKVMTLKKSETEPDDSIFKKFKGTLRKRDDKSFGFVDDLFVQPDLIEKNNLENGQELSGEAILSFNKKKEEWGWKVISIT